MPWLRKLPGFTWCLRESSIRSSEVHWFCEAGIHYIIIVITTDISIVSISTIIIISNIVSNIIITTMIVTFLGLSIHHYDDGDYFNGKCR